MPPLPELARRPADVTSEGDFAPWIARVVGFLLNNTELVAGGSAYRLTELEAYYHGPGHYDPFAHADPVQLENGRWYFHKTCGEYRGGSFKGLDLAFGDGTAHFGILIRSVVGAGGIIDGPSLTVDHLLAKSKAASVAALDATIAGRKLWDASSPLFVRERAEPGAAVVFQCSRVGLSLKKAAGKPDSPRFVGKPYRFLTEPRLVTKGKPHLVLALHRSGETPEAISQVTGVAKTAVARYVADFAVGKAAPNFDGYIGKDLSTAELCRMLGTWAAEYGGDGK